MSERPTNTSRSPGVRGRRAARNPSVAAMPTGQRTSRRQTLAQLFGLNRAEVMISRALRCRRSCTRRRASRRSSHERTCTLDERRDDVNVLIEKSIQNIHDPNSGSGSSPSLTHHFRVITEECGDALPHVLGHVDARATKSLSAAPAKPLSSRRCGLPLVELRRADKGNVSPVEMLCA